MYDETQYNLEVSERRLGSKLDEIYNPIAVVIESEEKKKLKRNRKVETNFTYQTTDMYIKHFLLNEDSKKDNEGKNELRCWICQKNHKVTDCSEIRNTAYSENINLVKSKILPFEHPYLQ